MLVNMGGLGNIGDRAMSLNIIRQFREQDPEINLMVGAHTNDAMITEFCLTRYPLLFHCFARYTSLESKIKHFPLINVFSQTLFYITETIFIFILSFLTPILDKLFHFSFMEYELAKTINDSEVLFFCGGGYINDVGSFEARSNLALALMLKLRGKLVIMSGQGFGPFNTILTKILLRTVIPQIDLITFRDKINSKKIVESMNINLKSSECVGDDASSLPEKIIFTPTLKPYSYRIAVNIRISPFTANFSKKIKIIEDLLSELSNNYDFHIDFFIFETWRPWEKELVQKVIRDANLVNYTIHQTEDPREALYLLKDCDTAIGISYHFIVFALKQGIPCIAIYSGEYYRLKMQGLLEWYDKTAWAVDIDDSNTKELLDICLALSKEKLTYTNILRDRSNEISNQTSKIISKTIDLISGSN